MGEKGTEGSSNPPTNWQKVEYNILKQENGLLWWYCNNKGDEGVQLTQYLPLSGCPLYLLWTPNLLIP